jgi:DNA-binding CsgD family transcriptional regulator
VLSASPARLERARCLHEFGAALRRANHRHAAQQALRSALHLAGECGALGVAESARTELAATGARPRRTALHGRDSLTPSELRVVQLAMEGRGNTAIAQALFVTRRTVETHLTKAYAKLDVRTRAELPEAMGARIVGDRIGLAPSGAPH